jgi:hypothetical protein
MVWLVLLTTACFDPTLPNQPSDASDVPLDGNGGVDDGNGCTTFSSQLDTCGLPSDDLLRTLTSVARRAAKRLYAMRPAPVAGYSVRWTSAATSARVWKRQPAAS